MLSQKVTYTCFTLWFLFLAFLSPAYAKSEADEQDLNGLVLHSTDLSFLSLFSQELIPLHNSKNASESLKDGWGFNVDLDIPVWKYLHSGFYFQFYRGLQPQNTVIENTIHETTRKYIGYNAVGFGMFLKPQIEIPFVYGNLSFHLRVPFGVEIPIGIPLVPFETKSDIIIPNPVSAYGLKTGASIGFEYFPTYVIGFFAEAGYQVAYHYFMLLQAATEENLEIKRVDGNFDYLIHGGIFTAGIKIAY